MTWGPIIVGVDASPESAVAVRAAGWLAELVGAACHLVHATPEFALGSAGTPGMVDTGTLASEVLRMSREQIEEALRKATSADRLAAMEMAPGRAARVLREVAVREAADLVVLGGKLHSPLTRLFGGSTARNTLRRVETSVLVAAAPGPWERILVATDVGETALPPLRTAERLAGLTGATLRVLHAIEPFPLPLEGPALADLLELERQEDLAFDRNVWSRVSYPGAERVVRQVDAVTAILEESAAWDAGLVVVGAHDRAGLERLVLGSVSEGILNALPTSVLVVRGEGPGAS